MPIFLIFFIVFLIWVRVKLKRNNPTAPQDDKAFWEREAKANFARAKDVSNLDYLTVDLTLLPFSTSSTQEETYLMKQVQDCASRKILNLSGLTNTDLKEQYGVANLEYLSNCDQNYTLLLRTLNNWSRYLYENQEFSKAKTVLEYELSIGSDISTVFTTLGEIYGLEGDLAKLEQLIKQVESSSLPLKDSVLKSLKRTKLLHQPD